MKNKRFARLLFVLMSVFSLSACAAKSDTDVTKSASTAVLQSETEALSTKGNKPGSEESDTQKSTSMSQEREPFGYEDAGLPNPQGTDFTWQNIPAYNGSPSVVINNNVPFFEPGESTTDAFQKYFDLDSLGRVVLGYGCLGPELQPDKEREDISSVHPTGFENEKYPFVDGGMVYNRCHLIAFMLAGQNANPKNLMTGTRSMNVDGMLPYEKETDDYIERTGNHVMYRVTPIFKGDDLVAQGVLMEAKSVEDDGAGLQFCVFCYNVEPGVAIDYATGENHADGSIAAGEPSGQSPSNSEPSPAPSQNEEARDYVLNTNSQKFHYPDCGSVKKMKAHNRMDVHETRQALIAQGYEPCKNCNP